MEKINLNSFVNVQAYKYNGFLYRQWNGAKTIFVSQKYVGLLMIKTKVIEKPEQKWNIKEPVLWFFSKTNFFNVTILCREEGLYYYVNLASPYFFEDNTIKFIDYDYDIKIYPNKSFSIVDHIDFEKNKSNWYDDRIINLIYDNILEISKMIYCKEEIFNNEIIYEIFEKLIKNKEMKASRYPFFLTTNKKKSKF